VAYPNRASALLKDLGRAEEPGILFSGTRLNAERLSALASAAGIRAAHYHAGLSREERLVLERQVSSHQLRLIVATSAFGMGMDFSHLSRVWLWRPPWSLLELAQAVGRVGRAGRTGVATLFWDPWDFRSLARNAQSSERRIHQLMAVRDFLERTGCRRRHLTEAFEESEDAESAECSDVSRPCDICSLKLGRAALRSLP
jgi:ATP-dependent DNA helicase RecQ